MFIANVLSLLLFFNNTPLTRDLILQNFACVSIPFDLKLIGLLGEVKICYVTNRFFINVITGFHFSFIDPEEGEAEKDKECSF